MGSGNNKKIEDLYFPFKDYVLALPGWYPTWLDPLLGDFNQRHIKAASLFTPQIVLYIGKDQTGTLAKTEVRTNQLSDTVIEYVIVYPKSSIKWLDVIYSNISFLRLLFKYSQVIKKTFGKPKLLHSYIVLRGGLAGLLLNKRWKIPFILTENWTIYYPADPGYLPTRNFFFRWLVRKIFKNLKRFLPVTNNLKQQVTKLIGEIPSIIIPNVVETETFNNSAGIIASNQFKFIHVSTMIYQKNIEGLLRTFKTFKTEFPTAFLQLVGPYPDEVFTFAQSIGLTKNDVEFTGAVSYEKVSELLKRSNALVLFSRYENLPCVILEAFCCGVPVISTSVGGIAEVINKENGLLIESENETQLLQAMEDLFNNYERYNRDVISKSAINIYSYKAIGKEIQEVYTQVLNN